MRFYVGSTVAALVFAAACMPKASVSAPAAKGPVAQLTPADLQARMKTIQATVGTVRMKLAGNALADAAKDAQQLATAFGDVERFWSQHNRADAVMWSQQARTRAAEIAGAAAANDGTKASAALDTLTSTCMQCHSTYREGSPQAGFRIKAGAI